MDWYSTSLKLLDGHERIRMTATAQDIGGGRAVITLWCTMCPAVQWKQTARSGCCLRRRRSTQPDTADTRIFDTNPPSHGTPKGAAERNREHCQLVSAMTRSTNGLIEKNAE